MAYGCRIKKRASGSQIDYDEVIGLTMGFLCYTENLGNQDIIDECLDCFAIGNGTSCEADQPTLALVEKYFKKVHNHNL